MNTLENIRKLETEIAQKQSELEKLRNGYQVVSRGDIVEILRDYEWVCSRGTRMWVDHVGVGHIMCRSIKPENRKSGIYWIGDGDYCKVEE